ncbi:MAG: efflux RND transporter periplasmic adaptor subunit [Candidatus Azambacteria bacterium]|nr:efflux RND transporter periplasmic adaptor subunit [Candidatus Azambacteria bacterium]
MKFFKKPIFIVVIIILITILGGYFYFFSGKKNGPEFIVAQKSNIVQEVSVTGNVKSVKTVDLAFEKTGRVSSVSVQIGSYVSAGQLLVREDDSELQSQLEKSRADLETQRAKLNESKVVLDNYYSSVTDILNDSYTKADEAVRKQIDSFFTDGESGTPKLNFTSSDSQAQTDAQNGRAASKYELDTWLGELGESLDGQFELMLEKSQNHLFIIRDFLLRTMDALNSASGLSQATIDTYKASTITARNNVNTALANIADQKQSINSQKAVIISNEASIKSYEASIKNIEDQIAKTAIYSPLNGVITKQDAKVGQIAAANAVLIAILSTAYKIEANIPEADIAKVKIGNSAKVTLDAYGKDEIFDAKVSAIDPAETIIEGVATYKTTLYFVSTNKPVKSGMTANIDILSVAKDGVIAIPQRAVISRNGEKFVRIYDASIQEGNISEIKVTTGIRGSDGNIEIIEGLKEGDKVVTIDSKNQ